MKQLFASIIVLLAFAPSASAALSAVSSGIDSMEISIGRQARLHYEFKQQAGDVVSVPQFADTIVSGVEIVSGPAADTIDLKDGRLQVNLNYVITSFDSGYYYLPPQPFALGGDTVYADALGLSVNTVPVDPLQDDVKDIKPIMDAPFSWAEFFKWVGIAVGILAVLALIAFVLIKYVFKKKVPFISPKEEPKLPPHVIALRRLDEIKERKAWQTGDVKGFYTEVTDVLREYLDGRFDINARELTSDEIMQLVKKVPETEEIRGVLKQLLELADLVKFAKVVPLEDESARAIISAFEIVDKTKVEEEPEAPAEGADKEGGAEEETGKDKEDEK